MTGRLYKQEKNRGKKRGWRRVREKGGELMGEVVMDRGIGRNMDRK